jgi:rod shape-determining protein MreD
MNPSPSVVIRTASLLLVALALQAAVFDRHPAFSVPIDLFLALAIAAGIVGGAQRGVVMGFVAGCSADLLLHTPFGLSALTYALIGYVVGTISAGRLRQSRVFPVLTALVAGALGVFTFAVIGELVGQAYLSDPDLPMIVLVRAVGAAVLVLPCMAALRWCWRPPVEGRMVIA